MPAGVGVSGLESDGGDRFFCGGGKSREGEGRSAAEAFRPLGDIRTEIACGCSWLTSAPAPAAVKVASLSRRLSRHATTPAEYGARARSLFRVIPIDVRAPIAAIVGYRDASRHLAE